MHVVMGSGRLIAGRYRLQWPIGRGAMGIVWQGRDELLDRDVAVKEVQITAQASPADAETIYQRTLREARTAARLSHPGVVTVFDVVEENGSPWIVMELVSARSLDRVITEDGPLPPLQAAELGTWLVGALAVAHAAGVLHRDVKPSNVLVTGDGRAVLTDFGIATFAGDPGITQVGMVVGTPGFTAPERVRGQAATPASDLWSLGATLYAAVEGRGPFDRAGGGTSITMGVATEDAPQAPSAGPLGPVIDALLRRDPAERPDVTTAAVLLADAAATVPAKPSGQRPAFLDPPVFGDLSMPEPVDPAGEIDKDQAPLVASLFADIAGGATASLDASTPGGFAIGAADADGTDPAASSGARAGREPEAPAHSAAFADPVLWQPLKPGGGEVGGAGAPGPDGVNGESQGRRVASWGGGDRGGPRFWWQGGPARPASGRWKLVFAGIGVAAIVAAIIAWDLSSRSQPSQALSSPPLPGISAQATTVAGHQGPSGPSPTGHQSGATPGASLSPSATTGSSGTSGPAGSSPSPSGGSPSPSPSPSHSPSPSPGPTGPVLPPGYTWHRFTAATMGSAAGFEIGLPRLWQQSVSGKSASLYEPVSNFHLVVNLAAWTYTAPLTQAQYLQGKYAKAEPGYKLLTLGSIGFKAVGGFEAASAAELKFKWTKPVLGTVTELVVVVTLPTKSGAQPYTFTLWAPTATFALANGTFQTAMTTFRPLPS